MTEAIDRRTFCNAPDLLEQGQQLAEDVRIGTGVVGTHVACWHAEQRALRLLADAWGSPLRARAKIVPQALREQARGEEARATLDGWYRRLYLAAEALVVSVEELSGTLLSEVSVRLLQELWGACYTLLCPVQMSEQLSGVVFLHSRRPITARQRQRFQRVVGLAGGQLQRFQVEQALTEARRRVILTEEEQRKSVAELLHGRVQTRLLVLEHTLEQALTRVSGVTRERLKWVKGELEQIREQEVRSASHRLHPAAVRLGLLSAVRSLAASVPETLMVDVRTDEVFQALEHQLPGALPEHLKLTVYRLIEEALANVLRHAQAERVTIGLAASLEEMIVWVRDNGRGFEPESSGHGLGLRTVADRVADAGGRWRLFSAPGNGTTLYAALPWTVPPELAQLVRAEPTFTPWPSDFPAGR